MIAFSKFANCYMLYMDKHHIQLFPSVVFRKERLLLHYFLYPTSFYIFYISYIILYPTEKKILNSGQDLMFELAQDEIECGMGVHGEAGYERIKLGTTSELVALMLKHICRALSLTSSDSVAVIVNNFGALSQLEQGIVVLETDNQLRE